MLCAKEVLAVRLSFDDKLAVRTAAMTSGQTMSSWVKDILIDVLYPPSLPVCNALTFENVLSVHGIKTPEKLDSVLSSIED